MHRKLAMFLVGALLSLSAYADTPPPNTVKAKVFDGSGTNSVTSTSSGGKQGLDVNVINGGGSSTVNQGTPNGGGANAWYVQGLLGRTWNLLNTTDSVSSVQSGAWTTGRTWSLLNTTDSVNVGNFPATFGVTQSTSPWVISGTVAATQSGTWSVGRTWTLGSGTDSVAVGGSVTVVQPSGSSLHANIDSLPPTPTGSNTIGFVNQGLGGTSAWLVDGLVTIANFPGTQTISGTVTANAGSGTFTVDGSGHTQPVSGTVAATQSGAWTTGRTWSLSGGTDTVTANAGSGTFNVAGSVSIGSGSNTIGKVDQGTGGASAWKVDGSAVTQPISAASLPLPTGASTSANQTNGSQKTQVVDGSGTVQGPMQTISATNYAPVVLAASATPGAALVARSIQVAGSDGTNAQTLSTDTSGNLNVNTVSGSGRTSVQLVRNDYSSTNVTTGAYVQLVASTSATINQLFIFDSSGQTLFLAVGGAGSEVNKAYIVPGGNGELNLTIPSGSRVSVKAVSASATSGELSITFLK